MTLPAVAAFLQAAPPQDMMDMVLGGTWPTKVVIGVLVLFSILGLWIIWDKSRQFRQVRLLGDQFLDHMERTSNLAEAYTALKVLPDSPYTRVFQQGMAFFSELRPSGATENGGTRQGLSLTQLEALRMVLDKVEAEEMDELAHGLTWLATIGAVAPSWDSWVRSSGS